MNNIPVAPPLTGQARLDYISALWQVEVDDAVIEEERSHLPPFNASAGKLSPPDYVDH